MLFGKEVLFVSKAFADFNVAGAVQGPDGDVSRNVLGPLDVDDFFWIWAPHFSRFLTEDGGGVGTR